MPFDAKDFKLSGPALPEPFVRLQLEEVLRKQKLLPAAKDMKSDWDYFRRHLRRLGETGGSRRVKNHVLDPLVEMLGYATIEQASEVETREGPEDGGFVMKTKDGSALLRCWTAGVNTDLDAPTKRGRAFRFSLQNIALRVLWKQGERAGLITDGDELRLVIVNPSGRESFITFDLTRNGWRGSYSVPDSFRLLIALASPAGIAFVPDLTEKARLAQAEVTKTLRDQARNAITDFLQGVLQHHDNRAKLSSFPLSYVRRQTPGGVEQKEITDTAALATELWREGLIVVYRLLFILKLESSPDPARAFSFASTMIWRKTYSPNTALAEMIETILTKRKDTGSFMEDGLRALFRLFVRGLKSPQLNVSPLGGQLFGPDTTPLLDQLKWGEHAVARLLQHLLWTPPIKKQPRMRVHYGYLDVEDLGRVYEALLEREPGIATERMCRLKRDKLEVVVPYAQGEPYRIAEKKSKVEWVEEIPADRFYLRVGLGRKSSGSYYTPDAFVKFLVQETLGPLSVERSPLDDPQPGALLTIKVLDPAMGSGHFLVEACRFLGERLYEACRRCDELAMALQAAADAKEEGKRIEDRAVLKELDAALLDLTPAELRARADELYRRVQVLPDPNDELLKYLPSRSVEGGETTGVSVWKARALCRRLVAVHCLYGVDKNPLAVELAKLVLWLESYSEGYPLTFLNHRLIQGDSLTGPFFKHLSTHPIGGESVFTHELDVLLGGYVKDALAEVRSLEASIGKDVPDNYQKELAEQRLRQKLAPLNALAAAWSGGVMLGRNYEGDVDAAYDEVVQGVASRQNIGVVGDPFKMLREANQVLDAMLDAGREGVAYDLRFPEVFWREGDPTKRTGFDVVLGNPPWDRPEVDPSDYFPSFDSRLLLPLPKEEAEQIHNELISSGHIAQNWLSIRLRTDGFFRQTERLYDWQQVAVGGRFTLGRPDLYRLFAERWLQLGAEGSFHAWVNPESFHAKEGATGVRNLYFLKNEVLLLFSFENKRQLFEIDTRKRFDLLVARKRVPRAEMFDAAFYLHDPAWLFQRGGDKLLSYRKEWIKSIGGSYLTLCEAASHDKLAAIATTCDQSRETFGQLRARLGLVTAYGMELHRNPAFQKRLDPPRFPHEALEDSSESDFHWLPLHAGKTVTQFSDSFDTPCIFYADTKDIMKVRHWKISSRYFRWVFRRTASSTNERTFISCLITPGFICEQTLAVESKPQVRANVGALLAVSLTSGFIFDWHVRQRVTTDLSIFAIDPIPIPDLKSVLFLAHSAMRLSCNHAGYEPLWREQLCYKPESEETWREDRPPFTWPVLEGDDARWRVRAAIDAVVAQAYGLTREQYEHILASFSHKSYPKAPALCLAMWDELHALGLEAFTRKHDPYWDIPLNEALPTPVINLPGLADLDTTDTEDEDAELTEMMEDAEDVDHEAAEEEEEELRPAARQGGRKIKAPAKVVEVAEDWWIEFLDLPAETLVEVAEPDLADAAFDLGSDLQAPLAVRMTSDGSLLLGDADGDRFVSPRPLGSSAKAMSDLRTLIPNVAKLDGLELDNRVEYRAGARIHILRVHHQGRTTTWKAPGGAWPRTYRDNVGTLARLLRSEAARGSA